MHVRMHNVQTQTPVFFGGVNVFLQQKFAWFRSAPAWVDRYLNHPALLRWAGRRSGMTGGAEIGELTHSMLLGEEGRQNRELDKLVDWLLAQGRPDAVWLSTALLTGLARRIRQALGVPVLCSLQGEDSFLDGLDQPWRTRCWQTLAARSAWASSISPTHVTEAYPVSSACEIVVVARMQSTTMATSAGAGSRGSSATCRVTAMLSGP